MHSIIFRKMKRNLESIDISFNVLFFSIFGSSNPAFYMITSQAKKKQILSVCTGFLFRLMAVKVVETLVKLLQNEEEEDILPEQVRNITKIYIAYFKSTFRTAVS